MSEELPSDCEADAQPGYCRAPPIGACGVSEAMKRHMLECAAKADAAMGMIPMEPRAKKKPEHPAGHRWR